MESKRWFSIAVLGFFVLAALHYGLLQWLLADDPYFLSRGIFAIWVATVVLFLFKRDNDAEWLVDLLPTLGLLGTLVGLAAALGAKTTADTTLLALNLGVAIKTTLLGAGGAEVVRLLLWKGRRHVEVSKH